MKSARYCPVCGKLFDLALTFCPVCPVEVEGVEGILLLRVQDHGEGFEVYPHAPSLAVEDLPQDERPWDPATKPVNPLLQELARRRGRKD